MNAVKATEHGRLTIWEPAFLADPADDEIMLKPLENYLFRWKKDAETQ